MILAGLLTVVMLAGALAAAAFRKPVNAVIALALVSLIAAVLFYLLQAPDVAMAEAAIGTALTTAIFLIAVRRTEEREK
jgi:energy-converting hydrogenase B subunit D